MPALAQTFIPTDHNPDSRPEPFPAGRVKFMVLNSDPRRTKADDGSYLWLELEAQSGPGAGRKWWDQITLENRNPEAVRIGNDQLSALCHSVGYLQALTNSDVLHGRSGEAEVDIEPAGTDPKTAKTYPAKNVTKRYIVPGDSAERKHTADQKAFQEAQSTQPSHDQPAPANKPWLKKK